MRHLLKNRPVIRFNSNDNYLAIGGLHNPAESSELSVFVLVRSTSGNRQIIVSFDRNDDWPLVMSEVGSGELVWEAASQDGEVKKRSPGRT